MKRPRSNALLGLNDTRIADIVWSDLKWSPSETRLRAELNKDYKMDDRLSLFLQRVYATPEIMSGKASTPETMSGKASKGLFKFKLKRGKTYPAPKVQTVAQKIYWLYSSSGVDGGSNYEVNKRVVKDIWSVVSSDPLLRKAFLQNHGNTLEEICDLMKTSNEVPHNAFKDFIYFMVDRKGGLTYRLYLNAKINSAAKVVAAIKKYINGSNSHGIRSFKIAGPGDMKRRADTVVCYCSNEESAQKLGEELAKSKGFFNSGFFNSAVPGMTLKIANGIALGAEPVPQETGFTIAADPIKYPKGAQSFGTIRSELIAAAILNYNENKHIFGASLQVFKNFVAVAFRCNGLDPEHSAKNKAMPGQSTLNSNVFSNGV